MSLAEDYLIHSYIYYELNDEVITDYEFDLLCSQLKKKFSTLKYKHKDLIDEDSLAAGTGHHLRGKFPEEIKKKAEKLLRDVHKRKTTNT